MRTVIDAAGRLVVPKQARDELGLTPGTELELRVVDRRIEIEVPPTAMRLASRPRCRRGWRVGASLGVRCTTRSSR